MNRKVERSRERKGDKHPVSQAKNSKGSGIRVRGWASLPGHPLLSLEVTAFFLYFIVHGNWTSLTLTPDWCVTWSSHFLASPPISFTCATATTTPASQSHLQYCPHGGQARTVSSHYYCCSCHDYLASSKRQRDYFDSVKSVTWYGFPFHKQIRILCFLIRLYLSCL